MNQKKDTIEIDLGEILGVLVGYIWLILAAGLFCALTAFMISKYLISPTYESTTKIYILNKQEASNVTYSDVQIGTQLTKDYAELITSRYVIESVAQKLSLDLTYKEMTKKISVNSPTDTRIVAITVEDHDPVLAMNMANAVREVASEHIQNVMDIDAVNVVETANMPTQKASPSVTRWTLIGGFLGIFAVCAIVILKYLFDDTIKSSEDVQKYLQLSTLALIPMAEEIDDTETRK
ncbi:MAG: protein-tyrosine kinase [Lachnospiraceae bacterium]|nr:protein-tyrosine kinase [Lachnospiraceae bacterium]